MINLQGRFKSNRNVDRVFPHLIIKMRLMFVTIALMSMVFLISSCSDEVDNAVKANGVESNYIFIKNGIYKDKKGNVVFKVDNSQKGGPNDKIPPPEFAYLNYVKVDSFDLGIDLSVDGDYSAEKIKLNLLKTFSSSKVEEYIKDISIPLRDLVDLKTIEKLNGVYFRDKNFIYLYPREPCLAGYSFGVIKNSEVVFMDLRRSILKTKTAIYEEGLLVRGIDIKTAKLVNVKNEKTNSSSEYLTDKAGLYSGGKKMGSFEFCQYFMKYPNQENIIKKYLNKNISVCKEHYSDEDWKFLKNLK